MLKKNTLRLHVEELESRLVPSGANAPGLIMIDPTGVIPTPQQALIKDEWSQNLYYMPKAGTYYPTDGLFTPTGVLKIPDLTMVIVKFNPDGSYTTSWWIYEAPGVTTPMTPTPGGLLVQPNAPFPVPVPPLYPVYWYPTGTQNPLGMNNPLAGPGNDPNVLPEGTP